MSALGSLVVKLGLEYAEYTGGLSKTEQAALATAKKVQDTFDGMGRKIAATAGAIAGGLAAGFAVGAFKNLLAGIVETGARLDDLRMQTGETVEALSGLLAVGKYNDVGADQLGAMMQKLSVNLAGATEESKGTAKALQALGIEMEAFKRLSPAEQMQEIARGLDKFEDGAGKSAVAVAMLGKEGANALPFFNDLATVGELQAKVTTEQAAAAANLDDNIARLTSTGDAWKKELVTGMVPALDLGAQAVLDVMNGTGGMREEMRRLVADGSIREWTTAGITGLTYLADGVQYVIRLLRVGGDAIGAYAAAAHVSMSAVSEAVMRMMRGDFAGAVSAVRSGMGSSGAIINELGSGIQQVFGEETMGARIRARMAEIEATGQAGEAAKPKLDFSNVVEKNGKASKEARDPVLALIDSIEKRAALLSLEREGEEKLTEGQKLAVDVLEQLRTGKVKVTEAESELIGKRLESLLALEKEIALEAQEAKVREAARADRAKHVQSLEQGVGALLQSNEELEREIELIGLTNAQQVRALQARNEAIILIKQATLAELERRDAIDKVMSREQIALAAEIDQLRRRNELLGKKQQREEEYNSWTSMWQSIDQTSHDVFVNIFEDGAGTFKRLGQTLKAALLDWLYQMTIKKWIINVSASFGGGAGGSLMQAVSGSGAGFMGLANTASSLWSAFTGGTAAAMGSVMTQMGTMFGNAAVTQFGMGMQGMYLAPGLAGPGVSSAAGAAGAGAAGLVGWGAGVAGGIFGGRMISGGYSAIGGSGNTSVNVGTIAGALLGGPLGALLGGLAGGLVNRLFGRKLKDTGIEGDFGGETGFEGRTYQYFKGGLFRSNKTVYGELDEETRSNLADTFGAMRAGARNMAEVLGLGTEAIDTFSAHFKVSLHGLSAEDADKRLREEFDKIADSLASVTLGTDEYTHAGETALQTLTRLSGSLAGVNAVLEDLNHTMLASTLAGADMASQLLDLFGGADGFNQATAAFFQNFYSPEEQREAMRRSLQSQLDQVGLQLPDIDADNAREQFAALAKAQDLTTEEGRRAWAALMQLSGAFASITRSAEEAATAQEELARQHAQAEEDARRAAAAASDRAWDAMQRSIDAARAAAQAEIELREQRVAATRTVLDISRTQARELRGQVAGTAAMAAAQARSFIDQAVASARAGQGLPDGQRWSEVLSAARGSIDPANYSSRKDWEAAQLILANKVDVVGDVGQQQLSLDEQALEHSKSTVDRLDQMLSAGRQALDAARGNTVAVLGVDDSVKALHAAIAAEIDARKAPASGGGAGASAGGGGGFVSGPGGSSDGAGYDRDADIRRRVDQQLQYAAERGLGHDDKSTLQHINAALYGSGISNADIARVYGMPEDYIDELFAGAGVPRFARGGDFAGGARIVGENGPELEVTGPARIYNARQTQQLLAGALGGGGGDSSATVGALRDLARQQYELLRPVIVRLDQLESLARKADAVGMKQRKEKVTA